jgi:hypothetical protein
MSQAMRQGRGRRFISPRAKSDDGLGGYYGAFVQVNGTSCMQFYILG